MKQTIGTDMRMGERGDRSGRERPERGMKESVRKAEGPSKQSEIVVGGRKEEKGGVGENAGYTFYYSTYDGGNKIWLYNVCRKQSLLLTLDYGHPEVWSSSIIVESYLYLIGGYWRGKRQSLTYAVSLKTYLGSKRTGLNVPRDSIGLAKYGLYIYAMGGSTASGYCACCEKYDVRADRWNKIPSLNEAKGSLSGCEVAETLYALGGTLGAREYTATIECLDVNAEVEGWSVVQVLDPGSVWTARFAVAAFSVSPCEIVVFGGWNRRGGVYDVCKLVCTGSIVNVCKLSSNITLSSNFYLHRNEVMHRGKVYSTSYHHQSIAIYNTVTQLWKEIPKPQWWPH